MKYLFFFIAILLTSTLYGELLKPQANLLPKEVISTQLTALQNNNYPYVNAGIEQTWEFAHPYNREYTGPLIDFIKMMHSDTYSIILNHRQHNINLIKKGINISFFLVDLLDKTGNKFRLQWIVEKVLLDGEFKDCWMTTSVSQPVLIAKSA